MPRKTTDFIAIHCSASPPDCDWGAKDIDRMHRARGWRGIGYHFVICRDGSIEEGRPLMEPGAHVRGYNSRSVGICMIGGVDNNMKPENNFADPQWSSLAALVRQMKAEFPNAKVKGHNEFPNVAKACPSFDVQAWLNDWFPDGLKAA